MSHLAGREFGIENLAGALSAGHRQNLGIKQPDLHQDTGLIPIDVLMRNLAVLEADHDSDRHLNWLSRGRNAGQKPIDLRGVRERDEYLIDNLSVADRTGYIRHLDVRRKELAYQMVPVKITHALAADAAG